MRRSDFPEMFEIEQVLRTTPLPAARAIDRGTGSRVLLKQARHRRSALREARLLLRVASPFTPRFIRLTREGGSYWLAVEWIDGDCRPGSRGEELGWITEIARALCHLHRWGVVHGDIKPQHILFPPHGPARIVDFDRACRSGYDLGFEEAGGTAGYVAPERLSGWPADPRSDLYSLARALSDLAPQPEGLRSTLDRMLAPSPSGRPARTDEIVTRFRAIAGPGRIPDPDLAYAGWTRGSIRLDTLAIGIHAYLGCDWVEAHELAGELLLSSGGNRQLAQRIWRDWLPKETTDPWSHIELDCWRRSKETMRVATRAVVRSLVTALPTPVSTTLSLVAQLGESISEPEIALLAELVPTIPSDSVGTQTMDGLPEALAGCTELGLLRKADRGEGLPGVRFGSTEVWSEIADRLDPSFARSIHRALACRISEETSHMPEISAAALSKLAWHHERAGENGPAAEAYFAGGHRALASGRNEEAVRLLGQGWSCTCGTRKLGGRSVPALPFPSVDRQVDGAPPHEKWAGGDFFTRVEEYAASLNFADRYAEAEEWLRILPEIATSSRDHARYHQRMAELRQRTRMSEEVLHHVDEGLRWAEEFPEITGRLLLHRAQTWVSDANRVTEGIEAAREACVYLDAARDARYAATARLTLGAGLYYRGEMEEAHQVLLSALAGSESTGFTFQTASAHLNLAAVEGRAGDSSSAREHLAEALEVARREGQRGLELRVHLNFAQLSMMEREWDAAADHARRALGIAMQTGNRGHAIRSLTQLTHALLRSGRIPEAEGVASQALELARDHGPVAEAIGVGLTLLEARVWYRLQPWDDGLLRWLGEMIGPDGSVRFQIGYRIHASVHHLLAGTPAGRCRESLGSIPDAPDLAGWFCLALSRIAEAEGDPDAAAGHALAARERAECAAADPFFCAFALLEESRHRLAAADPRCTETIRRCVDLAREARCRWIEARALLLPHFHAGGPPPGRDRLG
jgi:serine/threonine protein kinase/tetratricopeptide (TPR) repeat protein